MSHKLKAAILYDQIAPLGRGLYVWVDPDEQSMVEIQATLEGFPAKLYDGTEWHVTILHCRVDLPPQIDVPPDGPMEGYLREFVVWEDHKGRDIVVGLFDAPQLVEINRQLQTQGLKHSHPDFEVHMTFAKGVTVDAELRSWLHETNNQLHREPLKVVFEPRLKALAVE